MINFIPEDGDARGHSHALVVIDVESFPVFKELVHRAVNLWPDAPPEIKKFADEVTNGTVFQQYTTEKKMSPRDTTRPQYELDEDKKSINYHNCKNCGCHLSSHNFQSGQVYCP